MPNSAFTSELARSLPARLLALAATLALVLLATTGSSALAVEPGVNCSSYDGETCVVEIGDIWFCDAFYAKGECATSIRAGETMRWKYPASGKLVHTTTECGADCDTPTASPLWDSDRLLPGDSFERTFETPGFYFYYCTIHPSQRGSIRVLEAEPTPTIPAQGAIGDANCSGGVDSIDAALVLQLTAGLVGSLPCQENADGNADGTTNAIDATLILQFSASLVQSLPP